MPSASAYVYSTVVAILRNAKRDSLCINRLERDCRAALPAPHRRIAVLAPPWIGSSIVKNSTHTQQSVSNAFAFSAASLTMRTKLPED
jgi:hypothetical protein